MQLIFITAGRLDLFKRTICSLDLLEDKSLLTSVVIVDDASTESDLNQMRISVETLLPGRTCKIHIRPAPVGYRLQMETWRVNLAGDYSFHCEDDWEFRNPGTMLTAAQDVLQHDLSLAQVAFTRPYGDGELLKTQNGTTYWIKAPDPYLPYTSNPSVVRVSAFKSTGPFTEASGTGHGEHDFGLKLMAKGYRTAYLEHQLAWHTGHGRSAFTTNKTPR